MATWLKPKVPKKEVQMKWKKAGKTVINNNLEYYAAWDDQPSLEKLGLRLEAEDKFAEGMVKLNRAIELGSDSGKVWRSCGKCYYNVWLTEPDEFYHLEQAVECYQYALARIDTMGNPTVMFEAAKIYESLGYHDYALSVLGHVIERHPRYSRYSEVILRCAILLKHTSMHQSVEEKRFEGLQQALTYFEYIIPNPIEGWGENDIMMQVARLYELVPNKFKGKNKHMAKEAYKDIFKAARQDGLKSKSQVKKAKWRSKTFQQWFYDPNTWVDLGHQYGEAFEHTLAVDAYKEGLRRFRIDWETEMPSMSSWRMDSWSFQPHSEVFKRLALCYHFMQDYERALITMEQASKLAPYNSVIRTKLVEWGRGRWQAAVQNQDDAVVTIQRVQRGCWGRRRGRLRLTEMVNEAESRRLADRADVVARAVLRGYKGATWGALFSVEDACAIRLSAFAEGIRDRKLVRERREFVSKRALNKAVHDWKKDEYNKHKRDQLAALSPGKYSRMFYKQEKAVAKVRRAWHKIGSRKVADRRAREVFEERLRVEETAATVIQRAARSRMARDRRHGLAHDKEEQALAATALQSRLRGMQSRKEVKERRRQRAEARFQRDKEEKAARLIQARYRGHATRVDMIKQQLAAEKMQAVFRGRIGRKLVERRRQKYVVRIQAFMRMAHDTYRLAGYLSTRVGVRRECVGALVCSLGSVAAANADTSLERNNSSFAPPSFGAGTPQKLWGHVYALTSEDLTSPDGEEWRVHQNLRHVLGANTLCAHGAPLTHDHAITIADGLTKNKSIHHLVIGNASIGSHGLLALGEALRENCSLDTLALGANGIEEDTQDCPAIETLATVLRTSNFHLKQLVIEDNRIGEHGCVLLAQAVGDFFSSKFCRLQSMVLNRVGMHDDGGEAIGIALGSNRTLTSLQLCGNHLGDRSAMAIAQSLGANRNSSLKILYLADNFIRSQGGRAIGRGLRALDDQMKTLDSSMGILVDMRASRVNVSLCRLCLDNNFLREDVWMELERSMEAGCALVEVSILGNLIPARMYHHIKRYLKHRRKRRKFRGGNTFSSGEVIVRKNKTSLRFLAVS